MVEIYVNGRPTGLVYSDIEVSRAIARDMEREDGDTVTVQPLE